MKHLGRLAIAVMLLLLPGALPVAAQPADSPATEPPPAGGRPAPALHLSLSEVPGETTVRMPVAGEGYRLYGLLSPYLSLGSTTTLSLPGNASRAPGLQADTDRLDDVRLGAGMALPLWGRTQLYGEYRFLRGRIDGGAGRGLLQREPDSADFRAGFSIRLD